MMDTRLVQIYHADDNDTGRKFQSFVAAMLEYFSLPRPRLMRSSRLDVEKGVKYLSQFLSYRHSSENPYTRSPNFSEVLHYLEEGQLTDIIVIDMRWIFADGTASDTAGEHLIKAVLKRNLEIELFTNTIYGNKLIYHLTDIARNYRIGAIPGIPSKADLERALPEAFFKIAKKYISQATAAEKATLLRTIRESPSESELLDSTILLSGYEWRLRNLLLCCWNPETGAYDNVTNTLKALLADLTLAASECLDVFGIKQITHGGTRYFPYTHSEELKQEVKRQFNALDSVINMVKSVREGGSPDNSIFENTDYEQDYALFKSKCLSSKVFGCSKSIDYDEGLVDIRDTSFRFGSEYSKLNMKKHPNRVTMEIAGLPPSHIFPPSREKFEVKIPVHKIFEDVFRELLVSCDGKFDLHACVVPGATLTHPTKTIPDLKVRLIANFIVMRSQAEFQEEEIWNQTPTFFQKLSDLGFEYYGRYYIVIRKFGAWRILDCSTINTVREVADTELFPSGCILVEQIQKDSTSMTYHIFLFYSWRQE